MFNFCYCSTCKIRSGIVRLKSLRIWWNTNICLYVKTIITHMLVKVSWAMMHPIQWQINGCFCRAQRAQILFFPCISWKVELSGDKTFPLLHFHPMNTACFFCCCIYSCLTLMFLMQWCHIHVIYIYIGLKYIQQWFVHRLPKTHHQLFFQNLYCVIKHKNTIKFTKLWMGLTAQIVETMWQ